METERSNGRSGGILMWILVAGAILVGAYLVFEVMGLREIRDKINEDLGKKPVSSARANNGVLGMHQDDLRRKTEMMEKTSALAAEAQAKIDARGKEVRREVMQAEER